MRAPTNPPRREGNGRSWRGPREQGTKGEEGNGSNSGLEERGSARREGREPYVLIWIRYP